MGKSPHFEQGKLSQPQRLEQAIQPRMVAPPPPVYWPQPAHHVLQRKVAGAGQRNGPQASPAVPPVYYPHQAPKALQTKSGPDRSPQTGPAPRQGAAPLAHGARPAVAQLSLCNCSKSGGKHRSDCPANPKQKRRKVKEVKVVHQESQSIRNLYAYDSQWANKNNITEKMIKDFVKTYGVIHGHASSRSDKDAKRHENTTKDIEAFHSWYKQNGHNY